MTASTAGLATERVEERFADLDLLDDRNVLERLLNDQEAALRAVRGAVPALVAAVGATAQRLARGGRLVYAGAGTSGRLGQLDAAELAPTFSWPAERAIALVAGGRNALWGAVEGAEDDAGAAEADCLAARVGPDDVVVGIAASGTTPYVVRVLECARQVGALTVGVANNPATPVLERADHAVLLETGPEVLSGSTRLKAGTAQKVAMNLLSTAVMVRLGKVYGNLMVDVVASNRKLHERAVQLTARAAAVDAGAASSLLRDAGWSVKTAVAMARLHATADGATAALEERAGNLRAALGETAHLRAPRRLGGGLVVSCQARADNPLHGPQHMRAMALAAEQAGAVGIRANGPSDIRAIRDACDLPIIGIHKDLSGAFEVYITPTLEAADLAARAGTDIIAVDATRRPRPVPLPDLVRYVREELGRLVMADVSTLREGEEALALGVDYVGTTLSGFTAYSPTLDGPDLGLVEALARLGATPVIAEGRVRTPQDVRLLRAAGASAVVVGTAITNPREIAWRLVRAWQE